MSDAAAGIFISYRREEANYLAGWLHDRLADYFGESAVFLDIDWIRPGVDFMKVIAEAISRSGVMLVIIGPHWVFSDGNGRRLEEPNDPVRVELEAAFQQDVRVVPLLLDGAPMPRAEDLPVGVARLTRLNALRVGYESFRADVRRLVDTIAEALGSGGSPILDTAEAAVEPYARPRTKKAVARAAPLDTQREQEQQARLLSRLSRTYTEFLNQSVEHDSVLKLELGLDWLPGKTFRPQDQLLAVPERTADPLPSGASLLRAWDNAGGLDGDGLLLLGEPGAGKTTLLLELARRLAERAQTDPHHPLPVYLPLSGWATRRLPLSQWLVDQLAELYQVPRPLGRRWTDGAQLMFVLDGLDEIPDRNDRAACVKAINQFNRFGRAYRLPMLVASRPVEYETLPVKLQLETAIAVRPLDPAAVLERLRQAGPGMSAAVAVLQGDPGLLELLRSPLLVSMLTFAYAGVTQQDVHAGIGGTPAERRHQLITDYVTRRFELDRLGAGPHPMRNNAYPPERTRAWLSALARNLTRNQQTVFLLGRLPLDWLPTRWAQWTIICVPGLIFGLAAALVFGLVGGLTAGLAVGLGLGLVVGLGAGLGASLVSQPQPTERLTWSWTRARSKWRTAAIAGLGVALVVGLASGLSDGPRAGLISGLVLGLGVGLGALLSVGLSGLGVGLGVGLGAGLGVGLGAGLGLGLDVGLDVGLAVGLMAALGAGLVGPPEPAEHLSWSWARARPRLPNALIVALSFGLITGLPNALDFGLISGLSVGLITGLAVGLAGGLSKSLIPLYVTPNEGIRKSARNGLIVTLAVGLISGLIVGLGVGLHDGLIYGPGVGLRDGLIVELATGLVVGLPAGLAHGLGGAAQHGIIRLLLYRYHIAPLRYVRWLNYMVHLRLLYRGTSGGYLFIHRMVQEHFCDAPKIGVSSSSHR